MSAPGLAAEFYVSNLRQAEALIALAFQHFFQFVIRYTDKFVTLVHNVSCLVSQFAWTSKRDPGSAIKL